MKQRTLGAVLGAGLLSMGLLGAAGAAPLKVVAAENMYGDVARQLGGDHVTVSSILSNPDQDPHLFEASPSTARLLSGADLVVVSGVDYDPWMDKLLSASPRPGRSTLNVASLVGAKSGDNPHLWYDPQNMLKFASSLSALYVGRDPAHRADYAARLNAFNTSLRPLTAQIAAIRKTYAGVPVTATEPVFGLMSDRLGLSMRNLPFQLRVMNDAEPSASQTAAFEADLKGRKVRALFYNAQVTDPLTERLKTLANTSGVPVVGVTETLPAGQTYVSWMRSQLGALQKALAK